ncbi:glycosyltransferase family 61 protein [Methylobacterium symbioticum]|uniref:Glycosyltransferase 61 catalytic domain-containing protein n=2 Tax=Methylobacterium TaxID=407 RepID=A0A509E6W0_9HYPH|nr:glycosyltransferase family 61 protein [Methylobacterium symbioticum]VUD69911.1 hypothetical protein MET9862_00471 [Methylobacterium symbioticum]
MTEYVSCAPDALYPENRPVEEPDVVALLRQRAPAGTALAELYPGWSYDWPMPETLHLRGAPAPEAMVQAFRDAPAARGVAPPSVLVVLEEVRLRRNVLFQGRTVLYETHLLQERYMAGPLVLDDDAEPGPAGPGPYLYVGNQGSFNYGHWLLEDLPRLKAVEVLRRLHPGKTVTLVLPRQDWFNNRMRERTSRFFAGGPLAIVFLDPETTYHFPRLHYATPVKHLGIAKSPDAMAEIDRRLARPASGLRPALAGARLRAALRGRRALRLFIDRNPLRERVLLNRTDIHALVRARGFEILDAERLGVPDQAALFAHAEAVVGIKGAGLVNTVFCPPGTPVVHLAPETFQDPYYRDIAAARGQPYHALYGRAAESAQRDHLRDFTIDPADLAGLLDRIGLR